MATFTQTPAGTWKAEIRIKHPTRVHRSTRLFDTASESETAFQLAASTGSNLTSRLICRSAD